MRPYSVHDIERVLRLSRATLRGLIEIGFVTPMRGARREYRFSFQDLSVLRAVRALIDARVPRRRLHRALAALRKYLPLKTPLSAVSVGAIGEHVVVREGAQHFQVDDGQYVLGLDAGVEQGVTHALELASRAAADSHDEHWFIRALALEAVDPGAALAMYESAANENATDASAWINWGRLLHEQGRMQEAERVYRRAKARCGASAVLMFNFAVLLEDMGRGDEALEAYRIAIGTDPDLVECHRSLARLYDAMGKPQHAIRHRAQYLLLIGPS